MANALYDKGRQKFLEGGIAILTDDIKAALIDTGVYTVDLVNDEFQSDLSGVVATSAAMSGKSSTDGIFDATDVVFSTVSGNTVEAIVIFKDTGTPATSPLIAYIDTGTGLPVTPNGGDITVQWSSATEKIFKL